MHIAAWVSATLSQYLCVLPCGLVVNNSLDIMIAGKKWLYNLYREQDYTWHIILAYKYQFLKMVDLEQETSKYNIH